MAADDDFPRGWTVSQAGGTGVQAFVSVAAITGVIHVLTSVLASVTCSPAGAFFQTVLVSSSGGTFANFPLMVVVLEGAANFESNTNSVSGLTMATQPGEQLSVFFPSGGAGYYENLLIQGYDI
jgi:hypothetical protein